LLYGLREPQGACPYGFWYAAAIKVRISAVRTRTRKSPFPSTLFAA
jgi:hypothetical protein